ncbi:hypothetical protein IWW48_006146 [Coemansia sp. RSA 1200]|nr:hypothetical protein IWW48_006146 [Coemansia sp. RSA 1200]
MSAKIQIIGASPVDSDLSLHNEDPSTISAATELNRALLGIQQLILAYSFPESRLLLEKLVLPIFVPLVHWYAAEANVKENITIAESSESPSISDILREIVTTTLASMPHSASIAMTIELIQYARGSSRIGAESDGGSGDWPVFATHNGVTKLVWHSDVPELDQSHVPVDALLDILADSRLSGFVGDLFVTLLREQEVLMELVRSASSDTSDNGGISGLTHKWWLVSQTTMSIIERFGPSVLSRHSDVLAFILNVLDRYTNDTMASNVEDNGTSDERPIITEKETIESLMQTLEMDDEPDVEGKVGGTEIVLLALMLLGQLMSASEEKTFSGESEGFDAQSLKLLRTIHRQIKQIGANSKTVASVTQIARAVQMQVALVLALQGATGGDGKVDSDGVLGDTEVARFNAALRDVRNEDLVPVQAHGIIELRSLVLAKSNVVLGNTERLDAVIGVFVDKIKSADSFVYLNAVRGLSALADAHGQRFVPKLIELYCAKDSELTLDEQLRIGEALLQSIQRAGDTLPVYAPLLVPRLLAIVQNTDATQREASEFSAVRAHSALSILATMAQTSALALNRWMDLIAATVDGILIAESSAVELRRAAIVFWISLLRGFGTRLVEMVDMDILRLMHRTLRRVSGSDDEDELTRMHAQVGVEELDDVVKTTLFLPMAVRIRFALHGLRHRPMFHIVAMNARSKRDGKPLEMLGTYNPKPDLNEKTKQITLNFERTKYWLGVGAQPTDGVRFLLERAGLLPPRPLYPKVKRSPLAPEQSV